MVQRRLDVERVPEHQHVDHQAQRPQLVLLTFSITLADFAAVPVAGRSRHGMPRLASVQLSQDPSAIPRVIDVGQHYVELGFKHASTLSSKSNEILIAII